MRASRFSDQQIIATPQEAERSGPTGAVIRRHGISQQTFSFWRRTSGGLVASEAREHTPHRDEQRRPNQLVADLTLNKTILLDAFGKEW